ncbi:MAG: 3-keto-disaccharide hydrolase [Planctomycetota bacterium]|jgi:hypothetical protein
MDRFLIQSTIVIAVQVWLSLSASAGDIGIPRISPQDKGVIKLVDDRLTAWQTEDGGPVDNWRSVGKVLVNAKPGSHLITKQRFRDFDLSLEFSLPRGGNSGVYLRGRYEVQLYDGRDVTLDRCTGAIWGKIPVETRMFKGPNKWNQLAVRIVHNTVTVVVNRKPVIRSARLKGPTRGAIDQNETAPGPILLQSLRGVRFRNIHIREL